MILPGDIEDETGHDIWFGDMSISSGDGFGSLRCHQDRECLLCILTNGTFVFVAYR